MGGGGGLSPRRVGLGRRDSVLLILSQRTLFLFSFLLTYVLKLHTQKTSLKNTQCLIGTRKRREGSPGNNSLSTIITLKHNYDQELQHPLHVR